MCVVINETLHAIFGTLVAVPVATFFSSNVVTFTVPAHVPENVTLELSNNNQDYTLLRTVVTYLRTCFPLVGCWYRDSDSRSCDSACYGHIGAADHRARVGQYGSHCPRHLVCERICTRMQRSCVGLCFCDPDGVGVQWLRCKFGTVESVMTTFTTSTELRCLSPAQALQTLTLEVSNNNQDYTSNAIAYEYNSTFVRTAHAGVLADARIADPHVTSLAIERGVSIGGTLVTVTGAGFVATPLLRCQFDADIVVGTFETSTTVTCFSPPHSVAFVAVNVSNNNQDYSTEYVPYQYLPTVAVLELYPPKGPAGGGTTVTVTGTNFVDIDMQCRFGTLTPVPISVFVSSSVLECVSPASAAGNVTLELSLNDQFYTDDAVEFTYESTPWCSGTDM
jgi:hypothetical protein